MSGDVHIPASKDEFITIAIERAREGDVEAGKQLLAEAAIALPTGAMHPALAHYLSECFWDFVEHGIRIDRALNVEKYPDPGGAPKQYDDVELAATDILLRDHAKFRPEAAKAWITEYFGASDHTIRRVRNAYDSRYNKHTDEPLTESRDRDELLRMAGSMRHKVAEVLPQI